MDIHVVDAEGANYKITGTRAISNNMEDAKPCDIEHGCATDNSSARDQDGVINEPQIGMEFDTKDAAFTFYEKYAKRVGFSTKAAPAPKVRPGTPITFREFLCIREATKKKSSACCAAMLKIELNGQRWVVTRFVKEHNHSTISPSMVHYLRPKRHFASSTKSVSDPATCQAAGEAVPPNGVTCNSVDVNNVHGETNHGVKSAYPVELNRHDKNTYPVSAVNSVNFAPRPAVKKRIFGKDAQNMLDYFTKMQADNPGFFYAIQLDEENQVANAFWADARSRTAYGNFGDAVILDTSYRANKYQVPFAPFTGINHHGQTILFGCALLQDDSEASFQCLFKTFLIAMHDQAPISIITDQERSIKAAVSHVFPKTRHCISKWDVLREGQDRMLHVGAAYPNFQVELYNCINFTDTIEEFESYWGSIIDKYDLRHHEWIQSLYDMRKQWAPVYFRDSFFASLSPEMGRSNSFFEGYINQHTTLPMFFRQYENAMESWFEREREADLDTLSTPPILRTPSPMEKQAANLYTKKIFSKFQEELVETFVYTANRIDGDSATTAYRVAKFEDNRKAYLVTLNDSNLKAHCSCKMFEHSGILCRHVLTVFTVTNVLTLPSHYILKRWTKDAKSASSSHEHRDSVQESIASRYNILCGEAIRYAEEGSGAQETYKTALAGLREGRKKVAIMKRNVAKAASSASRVAGTVQETKKTSAGVTPLLWPRQEEMARQLKLNGSGIAPNHVADLNLPNTAPQRNNGTSDGVGILPCIKEMTWVMENKHAAPANRTAVINLKLQDYSKNPVRDREIKFKLTAVTLEPMMNSMRQINEQLQAPANKVAVINLKLQDKVITPGVADVKFQVSKDTLTAMLWSMAYIREQLCNPVIEPQTDPPSKRSRKK